MTRVHIRKICHSKTKRMASGSSSVAKKTSILEHILDKVTNIRLDENEAKKRVSKFLSVKNVINLISGDESTTITYYIYDDKDHTFFQKDVNGVNVIVTGYLYALNIKNINEVNSIRLMNLLYYYVQNKNYHVVLKDSDELNGCFDKIVDKNQFDDDDKLVKKYKHDVNLLAIDNNEAIINSICQMVCNNYASKYEEKLYTYLSTDNVTNSIQKDILNVLLNYCYLSKYVTCMFEFSGTIIFENEILNFDKGGNKIDKIGGKDHLTVIHYLNDTDICKGYADAYIEYIKQIDDANKKKITVYTNKNDYENNKNDKIIYELGKTDSNELFEQQTVENNTTIRTLNKSKSGDYSTISSIIMSLSNVKNVYSEIHYDMGNDKQYLLRPLDFVNQSTNEVITRHLYRMFFAFIMHVTYTDWFHDNNNPPNIAIYIDDNISKNIQDVNKENVKEISNKPGAVWGGGVKKSSPKKIKDTTKKKKRVYMKVMYAKKQRPCRKRRISDLLPFDYDKV